MKHARLDQRLIFVALMIAGLSSQGLAQSKGKKKPRSTPPTYVTDIGGIQLGQYRTTLINMFGPAIRTDELDDGWSSEYYMLSPDTSIYVTAYFSDPSDDGLDALWLNGHRHPDLPSFYGLRLGDAAEKLLEAFGEPTEIERTDMPEVNRWHYHGSNLIIEVYNRDHLYGIGIGRDPDKSEVKGFDPNFNALKKAILAHDIDALVKLLAPDVEIFIGEDVVTYERTALADLSNPSSEFAQLMFGAGTSVETCLRTSKRHSEDIRIWENKTMGVVVKFGALDCLDEIVYKAIDGAWRVWEVHFKSDVVSPVR